jgi:hypothetical protein
MLFKYHNHVKKNPDTLLCKFCGLYSFQAVDNNHHQKLIHQENEEINSTQESTKSPSLSHGVNGRRPKPTDKFYIVMKNVFDPSIPLQRQYDLKGSYLGRRTNIKQPQPQHRRPLQLKMKREDSVVSPLTDERKSTSWRLFRNSDWFRRDRVRKDAPHHVNNNSSNLTTSDMMADSNSSVLELEDNNTRTDVEIGGGGGMNSDGEVMKEGVLSSQVLKDLNFIEMNESKVELGSVDRSKVVKQLLADVLFLRDIAVMDYSLLLGISQKSFAPSSSSSSSSSILSSTTTTVAESRSKSEHDENNSNISMQQSLSSRLSYIFPSQWLFKKNMTRNSTNNNSSSSKPVVELEPNMNSAGDRSSHNYKYWSSEARRSHDEEEKEGAENKDEIIYFMSIIDFLQPYSTKKWIETVGKSLVYKPDQFSSVDPNSYAKRFVQFIVSKVLK